MTALTLYDFLSGAVTLGFILCGVHFLGFWKRTRDGLFLAFACAFWLLGINQAILALADIPVEERSWVYLLRLAAFVLIIVAVVAKNRKGKAG